MSWSTSVLQPLEGGQCSRQFVLGSRRLHWMSKGVLDTSHLPFEGIAFPITLIQVNLHLIYPQELFPEL
uniref:Uncharacterized protein n=1 Tax=Anguilla anguilla TaxID=7936 RepID=A0A0E9U4M5_ANGAN